MNNELALVITVIVLSITLYVHNIWELSLRKFFVDMGILPDRITEQDVKQQMIEKIEKCESDKLVDLIKILESNGIYMKLKNVDITDDLKYDKQYLLDSLRKNRCSLSSLPIKIYEPDDDDDDIETFHPTYNPIDQLLNINREYYRKSDMDSEEFTSAMSKLTVLSTAFNEYSDILSDENNAMSFIVTRGITDEIELFYNNANKALKEHDISTGEYNNRMNILDIIEDKYGISVECRHISDIEKSEVYTPELMMEKALEFDTDIMIDIPSVVPICDIIDRDDTRVFTHIIINDIVINENEYVSLASDPIIIDLLNCTAYNTNIHIEGIVTDKINIEVDWDSLTIYINSRDKNINGVIISKAYYTDSEYPVNL